MRRFLLAITALCLALPGLAKPVNNFRSDVGMVAEIDSSVVIVGYSCNSMNQCVDGNGTVCANPGWCKFDNFIGSPCACPRTAEADGTPPKLDGWYCTANLTCEYQTVNNGSATPNAAGVPRECWTSRCSSINFIGQQCQCPLPSSSIAAAANPTGSGIVQPMLPGYTCMNTICYAGNDTVRPGKCVDVRCLKLNSDGNACGCSGDTEYSPLPSPTYNVSSTISVQPTYTYSISGASDGNQTSSYRPHPTSGRPHGNHTSSYGPYPTLTHPYVTSYDSESTDSPYHPHVPIPISSPHHVHNSTAAVITSTTPISVQGQDDPKSTPHPFIPPYNMDNKHHHNFAVRDDKKVPCPSPKINRNPPFNFVCPGDDK